MILPMNKKKQKLLEEAELKNTGLLLGEITTTRNTNRVSICLIRAFLIFFACFGTVGALTSAFGLKYHGYIVIPILLLLSTCTAFLYYNRLTFYLGYVAMFLFFLFSAISLYWYVNSGYQAFSNTVYTKYSDYFNLLSIREGNEFISDRVLTVSIAMLFVSFLLCILLNITISGYMNIVETFLLTFPLLQIALYIDAKPALPYLAMLLSVYITVGILGRSGYYRVPSIKDNKKLFHQLKKKNKVYHSSISDGPGMLTIGIYSIILSSLFLLITTSIFFSDFGGLTTNNRLKKMTDEYVKTYVQAGVWGLLDRYQSTGGLSQGKLGGVGSIRPDFQTDLEVTFVPYTTDTLYLKSYTGAVYANNYFSPIKVDSIDKEMREKIANYEQQYTGFAEQLQYNDTLARMDIKILDEDHAKALTSFQDSYFMPYDSYALYNKQKSNTIEYMKSLPANSDSYINAFTPYTEIVSDIDAEDSTAPEYTIYYLPFQTQGQYIPNNNIDSEYEQFVYATYLDIPEQLKPVLDDFCKEAGLYDKSNEFKSIDASYYGSDMLKQQAERLAIASSLKSYFIKNFKYTMAPGSTPYRNDAVEYFLTKQKRGFCAHYASSSALLLRSMGIPTRYIEGYSLPPTLVNDAQAISTDTTNWFQGTNNIIDSGVVRASITDAQAHAWVEIYLDGYGWIPYEFTPPSDDEDPLVNFDFMSMFSGLFLTNNNTQTQQEENEIPDLTIQNKYSFHFEDSFGFILKPLIIIFVLLSIFFIIAYYKKQILFFYQWRKNIRKGNYNDAIEYEWKFFLASYQRKDTKLLVHSAPREVIERIQAIVTPHAVKDAITPTTFDDINSILQIACFSPDKVNREMYNQFHIEIAKLRSAIGKISKKNIQ